MSKYKTTKVDELMVNDIYGGDIGNIVNRVYYRGMYSVDSFSLTIIDKRDKSYQRHSFSFPNETQKIVLDFRKETAIHIKKATPNSIEYYVEQKPFER